MASKYSEDSPTHDIDYYLCFNDRKRPESCHPLSCNSLHICYDYILTLTCHKFALDGKCSHSHSLFTLHNQKVLDKKLKLKAKDPNTLETIAQAIRTALSESSEKLFEPFGRTSISDDDPNEKSSHKKTSMLAAGRGAAPLSSHISNDQSSTHAKGSSISCRLPHTTGRFSMTKHLTTTHSMDLENGQLMSSKKPLSTTLSLGVFHHGEVDKSFNDDYSSTAGDGGERKKSYSSILDRTDPSEMRNEMKYIFDNYDDDRELAYLFGPIREQLIKEEKCQISASGYCRLRDKTEGKQIERKMQQLLPQKLTVTPVKFSTDHFSLFLCTSFAEKVFEQNQKDYAIISEPCKTKLRIEIIKPSKTHHARSSVFSKSMLVSKFSFDSIKRSLSPAGSKFHIHDTNSTIDVISGDITQTSVDLMVCITTSKTLLGSVLARAGRTIEVEFNKSIKPNKSLILDGGHTQAKSIIFMPWKLEVQASDTTRAQKSLSNLVKECINVARNSNLKSISFPSIGTGLIGIDAYKVCEAMISAASECLHTCQMDVLFVIYSSSKSKSAQDPYPVFRDYLNNLCKMSQPSKSEKSVPISIERSEVIERAVACKNIITVTNSSNFASYHKQLVKLFDKVIIQNRYDLSFVQQPFIDQIDLLVDTCLSYYVIPQINLEKNELTLEGDRESCIQCFANLQKRKTVCKYGIEGLCELSAYVSMKIDEARAIGASKIRIEEDRKTTFDVDVNNLEIRINDESKRNRLRETRMDDSKIALPKWSQSLLSIRTVTIPPPAYETLECVHLFGKSMPFQDWKLLQIDRIENWPLYVHYDRERSTKTKIFFYGCSYSSVQSIIHYGLHSHYDSESIHLTSDALSSHIRSTRRSSEGKYYLFTFELPKNISDQEPICLPNRQAHLALPTYLIVYKRRKKHLTNLIFFLFSM